MLRESGIDNDREAFCRPKGSMGIFILWKGGYYAMYKFATINRELSQEFALVNYMDGLVLLIKASLKTVSEQLRVFVDHPELFTENALENASDTLDGILTTWENLDEAFKEK